MHAPSTRRSTKRAALVVAAAVAAVFSACGGGAERAPPARAPAASEAGDASAPGSDAKGAQTDDEWIDRALDEEGYCLAGETEICGCPGGAAGVRRCNATGTAFGPCDGCESVVSCGSARCEIVRIDALALSVAPCCPAGRKNRCGVDVSHFVALHGYTAGCLELDAPGTPDPSCPSVSLPMPGKGEVTLQGCRTPSGACGYDVDIPGSIDLGCTPKPVRAAAGG